MAAGTHEPRRAVDADLATLQGIVDSAYRRYLAHMDRPPGPMVEDLQPLIAGGCVWVVGQPISGFIWLEVQDTSLLIKNVAVHPDAQGAGVGRQLMDFAEVEAERRGLGRLWLSTNVVMEENVRLYTHLGFREYGRRRDHGYNRIFMEKVISPP